MIGLRARLARLLRHPPRLPAIDTDENRGDVIVDGIGHRDYVGGFWDQLGDLQFHFMTEHGLQPHHVLIDVACGSLRAGARFVPYLNHGNYLGLDVNQELIAAGIDKELGRELWEAKRPEFVVSQSFEFTRFSRQPDFALAQALFMHLPEESITLCMHNLRLVAKPTTKFYATFAFGKIPNRIELPSHPHVVYVHTRKQMVKFGRATNWNVRYIGNWHHPRGQVMVEYSAA
jgi:hypothetical protein